MDALDGNAIAGPLFEYFGTEMTTAAGTCGHCGAFGQIAELRVYSRAPGTVARCPKCGEVVLVILDIQDHLWIDTRHFQLDKAAVRGATDAGRRPSA